MNQSAITTADQLEAIYGPYPADSAAARIVLPSLHPHHRAFIALSPFLVLASADANGNVDVSPKGDLPGFVAVPDEHTLLIPDRPGNNKILTLRNLVENASVSMIFFVPGRVDTVRVNGKARIITAPDVLRRFDVKGRLPRSVLLVTVEQAWHHCGKALIRSQLWSQEAQVDPTSLPSLGSMTSDQTEFDAEAYDQREQCWIDARQGDSDAASDPMIEAALQPLWGDSIR
jgi:PPOX class probable FMN-dependent enzyme